MNASRSSLIVMVVGWAAVMWIAVCCTPSSTGTVADNSYLAEQLACVDESPTLDESKACRARVRRKWGVDAAAAFISVAKLVKDGGQDGH